MNNIGRSNIIKIAHSYIFTELYSKGFIKSKSFTYSISSTDLQNKIMHILKTAVNKEIDAIEEHPFFGTISFKSSSLKCNMLLDNNFGRYSIFLKRVEAIIANAQIGLSGVMRFGVNGNFLYYNFDNLHEFICPTGIIRSDDFKMKDNLDAIVNCVMFVPSSVRSIIELMKDVSQINEEYSFKLVDIKDMFSDVYNDKGRVVSARVNGLCANKELENFELVIPIEKKRLFGSLNKNVYRINEEMSNFFDYLITELDKINV